MSIVKPFIGAVGCAPHQYPSTALHLQLAHLQFKSCCHLPDYKRLKYTHHLPDAYTHHCGSKLALITSGSWLDPAATVCCQIAPYYPAVMSTLVFV
jgi:hypothetical protein